MSDQVQRERRSERRPRGSPVQVHPVHDPGPGAETVTFLPSLFCSRRCLYCRVKTAAHPEEDAIPLQRLEKVFAELRELGVEVVRVSGGDPLARKDIFDVIESLFEEGLVPDLPARLGLSYYEVLRLKDLGLRRVRLDLDSAEPTVADRMAGLKGYHARVCRLLESLRRAGLGAQVKAVLTPLNAPGIGRLLDYLGGLGNVESLTLTPFRCLPPCRREDLVPSQEDRELAEAQVRDRASLYPHLKVVFEERGSETDRLGFVILPDGRVTACEELYDHPAFLIGDLRRQSVAEVWAGVESAV